MFLYPTSTFAGTMTMSANRPTWRNPEFQSLSCSPIMASSKRSWESIYETENRGRKAERRQLWQRRSSCVQFLRCTAYEPRTEHSTQTPAPAVTESTSATADQSSRVKAESQPPVLDNCAPSGPRTGQEDVAVSEISQWGGFPGKCGQSAPKC